MFRRIPTIGRTYRQIARYGEIMSVFIKYGLGDLLATLRLERYLPPGLRPAAKPDANLHHLSHGDRLRLAFAELGPTFIKLGQFMSNRPDVLPQEIISALRQLQDSVAPFPAIRKELNFLNEASHIERFAENFRGDATVYVPVVYRHLTTKRILTTEFVDGIRASDVAKLKSAGLDLKQIAERGTTLLFKQIFEHGFFHADPHPGNILILESGVICFLDFGIMGILSPSLKEYLVSIMLGVVGRDPGKIARTLVEQSRQPIADVQMLEYDVTELLEDYVLLSLKDINIGDLMTRLTKLIITHKIRILPGFYLLVKAMITIEGVGLSLDPDFTLVEYVKPFAKKLMAERLNPLSHLSGLVASGLDLGAIVRNLPYDLRDVMRLVKAGRVRIEFEHRGLEPMLRTHEQLVDRLAFTVILASLIIGSSLVVLSRIPPSFHDIPVIGIVGFVVAAIMGFGLLLSIMLRRKM